jgi:hypothetical protein
MSDEEIKERQELGVEIAKSYDWDKLAEKYYGVYNSFAPKI